MKRVLLIAASTLLGAVAAFSATAATTKVGSAVAAKCPAGKVPVTIRGRTTCRPLAAALPAPRAGDKRVALLKTALSPHWGGAFKRGKQIRSPVTVLGAKRHRALLNALPQVMARLDALGSFRPLALDRSAKAGCKDLPKDTPRKSDEMTKDLGNGAKLDARMSFGPDGAAMEIGLTGKKKGGGSVRFSATLSLCDEDGLQLESCPTAAGVLEGTDGLSGRITVEQRDEDGDLEHRESIKIKLEIKLKGQTAEDAKLDTLKIDVSERYDVELFHHYIGPVRLRANQSITIKRSTVVNMRTRAYDPGQSNVNVPQQSFGGIMSLIVNEASWRQTAIEQWKKGSDEAFARAVKRAMDDYRARENAWQTPNTCATLEFAPASETLAPLNKGQTGQFAAKIIAKRDGGMSPGRWTLVTQENGTFAPPTAAGPQTSFQYTVTNAGSNVLLKTGVRATSKAGVAEDPWKQKTFYVPERIRGTFSGKRSTLHIAEDSDTSWTGTVTFVRLNDPPGPVYYAAEQVDFTITLTVRYPCAASDTQSASLHNPGGLLTLTADAAPGPKPYDILAQFTRETPGYITCIGPPAPWAVSAPLMTGVGFTHTGDFVLRGSFDRDYGGGLRESQSWNLAPVG